MLDGPSTAELRTTLIVEDDPLTRELLIEFLALDGVPAVAAATVAEAKALIGARPFACALLDKKLPDGSGLDVLRTLRELSPDTEAVILTGAAEIGSIVEALRLGASDYLFKPLDPTLFRKRFALLLERRQVREENRRLQGRLLQSERSASVGVLSAALAHELNSPLAYITANLNFLRERLEELAAGAAPAAAELLDVVDESREGAERMKATVDRVRMLEQAHREEIGLVDVQEALLLAIELALPMAQRMGRLTRDLQPAPRVRATRSQLLQVFVEVLSAAAGTERAPSSEVRVSLAADERHVEVRVSATPTPAAFSAFHGTGSLLSVAPSQRKLGASVCQGIAASLGGSCQYDEAAEALTVQLPVPPGAPVREVLDPSAPIGGPL